MKHGLFVIIILLLSSSQLTAQKQGRALIDSISGCLPHAAEDSNKVLLLVMLSQNYAQISTDTGIVYGEQAGQLAARIHWKKGLALAKSRIGNNYLYRGDHSTALRFYLEALKTNEELGHKNELGQNLCSIGNVYYRQKEYNKALNYYQQALTIQEKLGNKEYMATNLGNMANIYSHYSDTTRIDKDLKNTYRAKALDYYDQAYSIYKELGNQGGMARNLGNTGNIYKHDADRTEALKKYTEALGIYRNLGNKTAEAAMLINLTSIYLDVAADTTHTLQIVNQTSADKKTLIEEAIALGTLAVALSEETGYLEALQEGLQCLAEVYAVQGDFKMAFEIHKKYAVISDSIYQKDNAEQISKLETQNELAQKEKEIEIQTLEASRRRNANIFLASGVLLLLIVVIFVVRERKRSEKLLLNILPAKIAKRLKKKEYPIADQFAGASVLFIDMAGFTSYTARRDPNELVSTLNDVFTTFDALAEKHGLEKIKTIGDCYMAVSGLPEPRTDHALAAANMALDIKEQSKLLKTQDGTSIRFRMGLDCGPVVAGVIGKKKFIYDLWGDPVNTASRMESTGIIGEIQCTENFRNAVLIQSAEAHNYHFISRGIQEIKGKGHMETWLLS